MKQNVLKFKIKMRATKSYTIIAELSKTSYCFIISNRFEKAADNV